jgi:hypothetical protein
MLVPVRDNHFRNFLVFMKAILPGRWIMRRIHRSTLRSGLNKFTVHPKFILFSILGLLILVSLACTLPSALNPAYRKPMSLDQSLSVVPRDDRPGILANLGRPDAFRITFETLNSKQVRYEEWSYFDDKTEVDFIDGTLVSTVKIDPLPDGSIFASDIDPQSFQADTSMEDVKALFPDQQLLEVDATQVGVPGGVVLAGQRILLVLTRVGWYMLRPSP